MEDHLPHHLGGGNLKTFTKWAPAMFFERINELQEHLIPRKSVFKRIQRLAFRQRAQHPGENFVSFASALWELASGCGFGPLQEELVLDQLIEKAEDWRIRQALVLQINCLNLARAVELGSKMEATFRTAPRRLSGIIDRWDQQIVGSTHWRRKLSRDGSLPQTPEKVMATNGTKCYLGRNQNYCFQDSYSLRLHEIPGKMVCLEHHGRV